MVVFLPVEDKSEVAFATVSGPCLHVVHKSADGTERIGMARRQPEAQMDVVRHDHETTQLQQGVANAFTGDDIECDLARVAMLDVVGFDMSKQGLARR